MECTVSDAQIITSSHQKVAEEEAEFCWGNKYRVGGVKNDFQFYESFTYDGVDYFLYDSVYVWWGDKPELSLAKLVKMWETPSHKKRVKLVWYFQPCEIHNFLGDVKPLDKEVFLACGEGKGLFSIDSPEAIGGKCNVICIAEDKRNPRVSNEELLMADHVFLRTFDVRKCKLSERFPDEIAGHAVVHYFNRVKDENISNIDFKKKGNIILRLKGVTAAGNSVKDEPKVEEASVSKRPRFGVGNEVCTPTKSFSKVWPENVASNCKEEADNREPKRRKVHFNTAVEYLEPSTSWISNEMIEKFPDIYPVREEQIRGSKICTKPFEVTRRPEKEASKWFKPQPWEVKMLRAHEDGALVLLENLDPSYTSSEIDDMVWIALNKRVDAKMIPRSTFSSPHYGKALVAFKSKDAAETAISELTKNCLVLPGGRPIVARKGFPKNFYEETKFHGHLTIDRKHHKQHDEWRKAVSTSHYSQPNHIEHDMALGWRVIQEQSTLWWNALNEQHGKEIEELKSRLKTQYDQQDIQIGKEIKELENKLNCHDVLPRSSS